MKRKGMILLALLALALPSACGPSVPQWPGEAPAGLPAARWDPGPSKCELGEALTLRLHLALPRESDPSDWTRGRLDWTCDGGRIRPLDRWRLERRKDFLHLTRSFLLQWFRTGDRKLDAAPRKARRSPGTPEDILELRIPPRSFEVRGALPSGADREPEIPKSLIADPPPSRFWIYVVLGGLLALGILLLLLRRRIREPSASPPPPPEPPLRKALRRLRELREGLERGRVDANALVVGVTGALRDFFDEALGFRSKAHTTEELLEDLRIEKEVGLLARVPALTEFLRTCDLVKFAGLDADMETCRHLLEVAIEAVRSQEDRLREDGDA